GALVEPEDRLVAAVADDLHPAGELGVDFMKKAAAERRERGIVEGLGSCIVGYGNAGVVDHGCASSVRVGPDTRRARAAASSAASPATVTMWEQTPSMSVSTSWFQKRSVVQPSACSFSVRAASCPDTVSSAWWMPSTSTISFFAGQAKSAM